MIHLYFIPTTPAVSPELAQRCPGGLVGQCGHLHSGIACRICDESSAWDGTRCRSCEDTAFRRFMLHNWLGACALVMLIECLVLAVVYALMVGHFEQFHDIVIPSPHVTH